MSNRERSHFEALGGATMEKLLCSAAASDASRIAWKARIALVAGTALMVAMASSSTSRAAG